MKRLLVTGGAGFIGANFVHYWLRKQPEDRVVVLDALTYAGNRENLESLSEDSKYRFVKGDICDRELVLSLLMDEDIEIIVNFAAESHVDRSIHGPEQFIQTNINGTHTLLQAAKEKWVSQKEKNRTFLFHQVSTDEVYGSLAPDDPLFTETTPYAPNSPYAASKAAADHLVRAYYHTYGLPVTTSNCSNNYGPYQFPEKLIPLLIVNILYNKPLPVYGDGLNIRDWLYVEDHCQGIEKILLGGRIGEVYNIGGNNEWKNIDIIRLVCKTVDEAVEQSAALKTRYPETPAAKGDRSESLIIFVKDRPGHDRRYAIDAGKISRELGYSPNESFETGIRKTIQWYLNNEPWWKRVMDGSYQEWIAKNY